MVVPGFSHRPGVHCGSTALADVLRLRGVDLSEAMAFGLGAGLGFYYLVSPALSPTHLFQGRHAHLERNACEVLGAPYREGEADDPAVAARNGGGASCRGACAGSSYGPVAFLGSSYARRSVVSVIGSSAGMSAVESGRVFIFAIVG